MFKTSIRKTIVFLKDTKLIEQIERKRFLGKKVQLHKDVNCPYVNSYFIIIPIKIASVFFFP